MVQYLLHITAIIHGRSAMATLCGADHHRSNPPGEAQENGNVCRMEFPFSARASFERDITRQFCDKSTHTRNSHLHTLLIGSR